MTITWPPVARWAQGINADEQALSWVPESQVIDKVGYALPPGGHPELASGILLARLARTARTRTPPTSTSSGSIPSRRA